jgi:amino acid adenylation domain-containing protein
MNENIESILGLSPMQEGMLFHTLAASAEGMYVQQLVLRIRGELDRSAFEQAWTRVVARHQALRSAFVWESAATPLQVVFRTVELTPRQEDWSAAPEAEREARWRALVEADRRQDFPLRRPPLMRLTLIRVGEREHRFLFSYHHLLLDGWSGSMVFREVLALYDALRRGAALELPEPLALTRYAEWMRGRSLSPAEGFFRKHLAGFRAPTPLMEDRRGVQRAAPEQGFDVREAQLDRGATAALTAFARGQRLTLGTVLQGAWAAMLHRHSGEREVVFGAVSSGRPAELPGVDQLVGMFINTLPARVRIEPDDRLLPWLQALQRQMAELREYEYVPLVKLHPWSEVPAGVPLFETCQVLENVALDVLRPIAVGDAEFVVEDFAARTSDPITFLVLPGETVRLQLLFDRARLAPRAAERLLGHLQTWLAAVPGAAGERVEALPILTATERHQLTRGWSGPALPIPPTTVQALFAEQARRAPDRIAVRDADGAYTYRQLDERANRIAHALRARGAGPGSRVGLALHRSADMVAAVLGAMKAGATYVPLDPAFPTARLAFMARDARLTALVTHRGCLEQLPLPEDRALFLDGGDALAAQPADPPPGSGDPGDVAYVLYTSGSTGQPKGVQISQRALVNFLVGMQELPAVRPEDVLLAVTSLSFDIAGLELLSPLLVGAQVVVAPQAAVTDGAALREWLARSGATVMQATPATWRMLLAAQWQPAPGLRVLVGGEALSPDLARALGASGEVWNLYGPTETTIWSTAWRVEPEEEISIGRPIANTQVHVVDAGGQLLPVGAAGELVIGGEGLAVGYLDRPDLTAERFVTSPATGARVYRTGDLARWREDGTLVVLGRNDSQVKVRGHRIELGEVEAALNGEPLVRHAAVTVVDDAAGEQAIVGYVVADAEAARAQTAELEREQQGEWQRAWDDAYDSGQGAVADPTFNTRGWNSSEDGKPIPADQMRDWLEATVARIRSLAPRRILEVGCGTGLLLFRLARDCEAYVGVDYSRQALANVAGHLSRLGEAASRVSLVESDAAELREVEERSVDLAVINSVLQYLPGVAAAVSALERVVGKVAEGGTVFLGDVRELGLHAALWTAVHLSQAAPRTSARELRGRVERSLASERELLLDRGLFAALPGRMPRVASAKVLVKRGRAASEMTRFRHDVVLRLDRPSEADEPARRTEDWSASRLTLDALRALLSDGGAGGVAVRGVPNARVMAAALAARWLRKEGFEGTVESLRKEVEARAAGAVHPEDVWAVAESLGLSAELTPSNQGAELFDVAFRRAGAPAVPVSGRPASSPEGIARPWRDYANNPLQGRLGAALTPALRRGLAEKLPSYMIPSAFVYLDALPLTPNGKVDRRALPRPDRGAAVQSRAYLPPRDGLELQLVRIWEDVLGTSPVGVHEDFFDLGGHSILAVRLAAQVEKRLRTRLPLSTFIGARTVEAQALLIRAGGKGARQDALVCVQPGGSKAPLFCVHPAGGDVLCYRDLSRALGPDYPLYAFEAVLDEAGALRDRTVAGMADAYVGALRGVQPVGPYRLAGWSLGGLVAAEMAVRLRARGEVVSFVGVLDTALPPPDQELRGVDISRGTLAFIRYIEEYYRRPLHVAAHEVAGRRGDDLVAYLAERLRAASVLPPDVDLAYARRLYDAYMDHTRAFFDHQPSQYSGPMTLMRARTPLPPELAYAAIPRESRTLGWEHYCADPVEVIDVPGDHLTILTPGPVRELAERLRAALDRSEAA